MRASRGDPGEKNCMTEINENSLLRNQECKMEKVLFLGTSTDTFVRLYVVISAILKEDAMSLLGTFGRSDTRSWPRNDERFGHNIKTRKQLFAPHSFEM
jgi:hypothetical protein